MIRFSLLFLLHILFVFSVESSNGFAQKFDEVQEDELKDMETKWREDGTVELNFTSHGTRRHFELSESKMNLSKVAIRLLGSSPDTEVKVKDEWKNTKLMEDNKMAAIFSFQLSGLGIVPVIQGGAFSHNDCEYRVVKSLIKGKRFMVSKQPGPKATQMYTAPPHSRSKRDSGPRINTESVDAIVELVFVVDYIAWTTVFQSVDTDPTSQSSTALLYFLYTATIMDSYFSTLGSDQLKISVQAVGILAITTEDQLPVLVEDYVTEENRIDSWSALLRLSNWTVGEGQRLLPSYDHVMLLTKYDMYNEKTNGDHGGMAFTGKICDRQYSCSVVEVRTLTITALLASHELAHSLGAQHDGTYGSVDSCPKSKYIMSADGGNKRMLDYVSLFSCCSERSFYFTIHESGQCLLNNTELTSDIEYLRNQTVAHPPGEIFSADFQCKVAFGTKACPYKNIYKDRGIDICRELWCLSPNNEKYCTSYSLPAADGTDCGDDRVCQRGLCVDHSDKSRLSDHYCDVTSCMAGESGCRNGTNMIWPSMGKCYETRYTCDGVQDCTDASDEVNCSSQTKIACPEGYYKCTNGVNLDRVPDGVSRDCVAEPMICDSVQHCTDNSDESQYCSDCLVCDTSYGCIDTIQACSLCSQTEACTDIINYHYNINNRAIASSAFFISLNIIFLLSLWMLIEIYS